MERINKSDIYLGAGVAFGIGACILAAIAQSKAEKEKENRKKVLYYIPSAVACAGSVYCSAKAVTNARSETISACNIAAAPLIVGGQIAKDTIRDIRKGIAEKYGENKAKEIEQAVLTKGEQPVNYSIIFTGEGDTLFQEFYTKLYFQSSWQAVLTAKDKFNARLDQEGVLTLGDWLRELKLGRAIPPIAEKLIWESDPTREYPTEAPGYLGLVKSVMPSGALPWTDDTCTVIKLIDEPNGRWQFA